MGSTLFRDPQARSSALAALGSLQTQAFGSLNRVDPLDSVSNYYMGPLALIKRAYFRMYTRISRFTRWSSKGEAQCHISNLHSDNKRKTSSIHPHLGTLTITIKHIRAKTLGIVTKPKSIASTHDCAKVSVLV